MAKARAAGRFIGTAGCFIRPVAVLAALTLASCDETKSVSPTPVNPTPANSESMGGVSGEASQPTEARWTPTGGSNRDAGPPDTQPPIQSTAPDREGWAIVLTTFTTQNHREQAAQWLALVRERTPFTSAWIESDERGSVVRYGSYPSVDSKQAQQDLTRIKRFEYNGGQPFSRAYLSRYGQSKTAGRLREYHLSQALKFFPGQDTVYSLQIGVYEAEQDTTAEQARRLAEEAVMQLRAQGEMAFYYHGPNRSMVCIGAFPSTAVDAATGFYSADVRALQQRFPYNSFNGRSLKQNIVTMTGQRREEIQPSFLVQVPKD